MGRIGGRGPRRDGRARAPGRPLAASAEGGRWNRSSRRDGSSWGIPGGGGPGAGEGGAFGRSSLRPERRPRRSFQPLRFSWSSWLTRAMSQLAAASGSSGGATGAMFRGGRGGRRGRRAGGGLAPKRRRISSRSSDSSRWMASARSRWRVRTAWLSRWISATRRTSSNWNSAWRRERLVLAGLELAHEPAEDGGLGLGRDQVQRGRGEVAPGPELGRPGVGRRGQAARPGSGPAGRAGACRPGSTGTGTGRSRS